jgi:hypothetical protein
MTLSTRNSSGHWNAAMEGLAQNVLKMYREYNVVLYVTFMAAYLHNVTYCCKESTINNQPQWQFGDFWNPATVALLVDSLTAGSICQCGRFVSIFHGRRERSKMKFKTKSSTKFIRTKNCGPRTMPQLQSTLTSAMNGIKNLSSIEAKSCACSTFKAKSILSELEIQEENHKLESLARADVAEYVEDCKRRRRMSLAHRANEKRRHAR